MASAIPCAQCHTLSAWGQTKCVHCSAWIVVTCLFCEHLSPVNQSACLSCGEAFAGMAERKAAREAEVSRQHTLEAVSAFAPAGASLLGALAGAVIGSELSHHASSSSQIDSGGGLLDGLLGGSSGSWLDDS